MPFIRGRYYINPIAGAALEAARDAEAALRASQQESQGQAQPGEDDSPEDSRTMQQKGND